MNHAELCTLAGKWLKKNNFGFIAKEVRNSSGEEPDAIGFKSNQSCLVECKTSLSDFKADSKKRFRINPGLGMGNNRFYLCPEGLIKPEDLPDNWGLLYEVNGKIKMIVGDPRHWGWVKDNWFDKNLQAEYQLMYSCLRR